MWSPLGDFIAPTTRSHSALRYCRLTNGVLPTTDNYETLRPVIVSRTQILIDKINNICTEIRDIKKQRREQDEIKTINKLSNQQITNRNGHSSPSYRMES